MPENCYAIKNHQLNNDLSSYIEHSVHTYVLHRNQSKHFSGSVLASVRAHLHTVQTYRRLPTIHSVVCNSVTFWRTQKPRIQYSSCGLHLAKFASTFGRFSDSNPCCLMCHTVLVLLMLSTVYSPNCAPFKCDFSIHFPLHCHFNYFNVAARTKEK